MRYLVEGSLKPLGRSVQRLAVVVSATAVALLLGSGAGVAAAGHVYTGNISQRQAEEHLLGASPRDSDVVGASFRWNGRVMVLRVHVRHLDPLLMSSTWRVTQLAALDLDVNGRTRMVDTFETAPGSQLGYGCGANTAHITGRGASRSYATNTYVFRIPRAAILKCGIRPGQVVLVDPDSMMGTDNAPSMSDTWQYGEWAARWNPIYSFRL